MRGGVDQQTLLLLVVVEDMQEEKVSRERDGEWRIARIGFGIRRLALQVVKVKELACWFIHKAAANTGCRVWRFASFGRSAKGNAPGRPVPLVVDGRPLVRLLIACASKPWCPRQRMCRSRNEKCWFNGQGRAGRPSIRN